MLLPDGASTYIYLFPPVLFLEINSLHSLAYSGHYLVRDGSDAFCEYSDRQAAAKYLDGISLLAVDVRDVNHCHVHADITYVRCRLSVDDTEAPAVS